MEAETDVSEPPVENEAISDEVEAATDEPEPTTVTTQPDLPESADSSEIQDYEPTYSLEDMDEIRKWWEIPCVAHFCSLFRAAFDLPDFDIEELEEALLASGTPEGSLLMCDLISQLLNGCYGRTDIKSYNFEVYLKDIFKKRGDQQEGFINPLDDTSFQMLVVRTKLELLQGICDYRLDSDDVQDLLKGLDGDNLRVEPMGRDQHGATYWYFYGVRLYKEDPELKPDDEKKKEQKKAKRKTVKVEQKKKTPSKSKRGRKKKRGRPSTGTTRSTPARSGGKRGRPRTKGMIQEEIVPKEDSPEETVTTEEATPNLDDTPGRRSNRRQTPKSTETVGGDAMEEDEEEQPATPSDETPSRRTRRLSRKAQEVAALAVKEESNYDDTTEDESDPEDEDEDQEEDEPVMNGDADSDDDIPLASLKKEPVPPQRWHLICQNLEDWQALAESFKESKVRCEKTMYRTITEDFLPEIPRIIEEKERDMKRRALENAPRRTSCRLEEKQKQREEEQAEEDKHRQQEEEARRRILEQEKLEIQKRQREEREKQRERMKEERERAVEMRAKRAALREEKVRLLAERERMLAEGLELPPELQNLDSNTHKDEDEDEKLDSEVEELYSGMRKTLSAIKAHDDSWPFWEPVKEEFAPDYFKFITTPMDLTTIEKKLDNRDYCSLQEFSDDFQLLFDNCEKYNGESSDFTYMARTLEKMFKLRVRRLTPKRVSRYDHDDDFIMEESFSPSKQRPKRQTAAYAMENIHAVMMDQDEDADSNSATNKSKYTIIYPALQSRGDDMRTAEGQARFLQALQAAKRKEAAEEFNNLGNRSLKIQTNTVSIPKNPMRPASVEDPVKGIIVHNSRNKMQLLAKTVSVTSRYNGQPPKSGSSEEDPELASLPMHKRIREREAQKALNKLGEPKAEPVNDYISVVRKSDVSRLYSGLIQKTPKQVSPQKYSLEKAPAANISPKVVHISLDDFKRLQSQKAKVICVPSRDAGKSGTVIHLSTGGIRTAMSTTKADSFVSVNKEEQKATPAQGVVPSKDVKVLEHSSDKVTVLKTTPATQTEDTEMKDETEEVPDKAEDTSAESMEIQEGPDGETAEGVEVAEESPEIAKDDAEKIIGSPKQAQVVPKLYIKVPPEGGTKKTSGQTPKIVKKTKKKKTVLISQENEEAEVGEEDTSGKEAPKTNSKSPKTPVGASKKTVASPKTPVLTPKTIMKIKKTALKTPQSKDEGTQKTEDDSAECPVPRKKMRKSVSWSKNLTTESPYVPPVMDVQSQTPPRATCLYKDGIHSRMPRMHAAPLQTTTAKEPEIGSEKTVVNGMIVTKSVFQSQPVIKTYSKKEPERKRSYESDFFLEEDNTERTEPREPSPPKLTRIEQSEDICDHSEEAPPDIISDHENDSSQTSDSETKIQLTPDSLIQKNMTKLHTSLYTYSGGRKKKKASEDKPKPESNDDDSTCAKVVRRTKRSPQALRQMRHTRVTAPPHDDLVSSSAKELRRPGRPGTLIAYNYKAALDKKPSRSEMKKAKEQQKKDSETQVEDSETDIQEPVLDLVSEVNMEDLEEGSIGEADTEMIEKTTDSESNVEQVSAAEEEVTAVKEDAWTDQDQESGVSADLDVQESTGPEDVDMKNNSHEAVEKEASVEDEREEQAGDSIEDSTSQEDHKHSEDEDKESEALETILVSTEANTVMESEETELEDRGVNTEPVPDETETGKPHVEDQAMSTEDIYEETGYVEQPAEDQLMNTVQTPEEAETSDVYEDQGSNTEQIDEETEHVEQPAEDEEVNTEQVQEETEYGGQIAEDQEITTEEIDEETEDVEQSAEDEDMNTEQISDETEDVEQPAEDKGRTTEQIEEEKEYVEEPAKDAEEMQTSELNEDQGSNGEQIDEETEYVEQLAEDEEISAEQIDDETTERNADDNEQVSVIDTANQNVEEMEESTEQVSEDTAVNAEEGTNTDHISEDTETKDKSAVDEPVTTEVQCVEFESTEQSIDGETETETPEEDSKNVDEEEEESEVEMEYSREPVSEVTVDVEEDLQEPGHHTESEVPSSEQDNDVPEEHVQDNDVPEEHVQDNDGPEEHVQDNDVPEEHVQDNDGLEEHVQDNDGPEEHVQDNDVPGEHVQDNDSPEEYVEEEVIGGEIVTEESSEICESSDVPVQECVSETEEASEQDQVDAMIDSEKCRSSDQVEMENNIEVARDGEEEDVEKEEEEDVIEIVEEPSVQEESVDQREFQTVSPEDMTENVSEEISAENDSSLMETEPECFQNTVSDIVTDGTTAVSEFVDVEMAEQNVDEQIVGTHVELVVEDDNQNTDISVSRESLHSEETGDVSIKPVHGVDEVDSAKPDVLSGRDTENVAQAAVVSDVTIPMETDYVEETVIKNQEISVQVIDYDDNVKGEQSKQCDSVILETHTGSSQSEPTHCSDNREVSEEQNRDDFPESEDIDPPVLQRISPAELEKIKTVSEPNAPESVNLEVSAIPSVAELESKSEVSAVPVVAELDKTKSDISAVPYATEVEQTSVNGTEAAGDMQSVTDASQPACDFKSPSNDPVKRSSKSPVFSAPPELLQKHSPPRLSQGKSQSGKGSPENSPQKVSPNSSPSKSGCVDRNVFSEFASNVNSEAKTSPSSSPGKSSSSMLNLPRGFAASLNKLKFTLPSKTKTPEDQSSDGSS